MDLKPFIRTIPDFPEKGVLFRDITTLLKNPEGLRESINAMKEAVKDIDFDIIAGPESRGFIFSMPLAYEMGKGFIPVRKPGKLPAEVIRREYSLEYGTTFVEMHKDAIEKGQKVLIVDDLLATGGTAKALAELIEEAGGQVAGFCFLIELNGLNGKEQLAAYPVKSVLQYD